MDRINEAVIISGKYDLAGTLTRNVSNQKQPAVLIISGTGKLNRDGSGFGFKMNIYKDLAESLCDMGYITLRYDKRGVGKSGGDNTTAGLSDLVDDVVSCVKFLKSLPNVDEDRVVLAGHSEGCIIAALASKKETVGGMMLLSGAGVCLKTSMVEQAYSLVNETKTTKGLKGLILRLAIKEKSVIAKQKKLFNKVLNTTTDTARIQMVKFPAKWMREHLNLSDQDILQALSEYDLPILAVTGAKDIQTDYRNLDMIRDLNKENIQVEVIENMDHMLKHYDGKMTILDVKKQYKKEIGQPLHSEFLNLLKVWSDTNIMGILKDNAI